MKILVGTPKKVFNVIFDRFTANNPIDSDELKTIFKSETQLEEDLLYLENLGLIETDYQWKFILTTEGRIYNKELFWYWFEKVIISIIFPLIVAFITALITTLLALPSEDSSQQTQALVLSILSKIKIL